MSNDVARFKYQKLLRELPEGRWLTTAEYFAAVPRPMLGQPWQAHAKLAYLAKKKLLQADTTSTPLRWCRPSSIIPAPGNT